jgi:hypothetical protein
MMSPSTRPTARCWHYLLMRDQLASLASPPTFLLRQGVPRVPGFAASRFSGPRVKTQPISQSAPELLECPRLIRLPGHSDPISLGAIAIRPHFTCPNCNCASR